jgi:hypothetical protein
MPFKSEKQRRYLHANHPDIAKRWEQEYSGGGIARMGYAYGDEVDTMMTERTPLGNLMVENTNIERPTSGYENEQRRKEKDDAFEQLRQESPELFVESPVIMRDFNYDQGIDTPDISEFIDDYNYTPRTGIMEAVNEDRIPGRIQEAALPKSNMFGEGLEFLMDKGTGIRQGLSLANENYLMPAVGGLMAIANRYNPLREGSQNYNPDLQGQVDMLNQMGMLGDQSSPYKITSGPLAGKNLVSGFGTNDYRKMLQKRIEYFKNKKSLTESQNRKMHETIAEEKRILEKKTREAAAAAASQRRAGKGGDHMSRSRSQGGLGISRSQAQSVSDANRAAGMSGWGL